MRGIAILWLAMAVAAPRHARAGQDAADGVALRSLVVQLAPSTITNGAPPSGADVFTLQLPTPEKLFTVHSEASVRAHIRQENVRRGIKMTDFPADTSVPADSPPRMLPPQAISLPSGTICYRNTYFEDPSRERDLKSCGGVEPLREVGLFYADAFLLPVKMVMSPPWRFRCAHYPLDALRP